MDNIVIYVHGKGGSADEAEHYKPFFLDSEVIGFDYRSQTPWEAKEEFFTFFAEKREQFKHITLIANSIGVYFSLSALDKTLVDNAFFISPVVDMVNTHSVRLAIQNTVRHCYQLIYHFGRRKSPLCRAFILFQKLNFFSVPKGGYNGALCTSYIKA